MTQLHLSLDSRQIITDRLNKRYNAMIQEGIATLKQVRKIEQELSNHKELMEQLAELNEKLDYLRKTVQAIKEVAEDGFIALSRTVDE